MTVENELLLVYGVAFTAAFVYLALRLDESKRARRIPELATKWNIPEECVARIDALWLGFPEQRLDTAFAVSYAHNHTVRQWRKILKQEISFLLKPENVWFW